jgi:YD repeat-containing protein
MKSILLALVIIVSLTGATAQTVEYNYDANGNRISRVIVLKKSIDTGEITDTESLSHLLPPDQAPIKDHLDKANITIYPNPTNSTITIEMSAYQKGIIMAHVLSSNGSLLLEGEISNQNNYSVDLSSFASGQYYLVLSRKNEKISYTIIKN